MYVVNKFPNFSPIKYLDSMTIEMVPIEKKMKLFSSSQLLLNE